LTRAPAELPPVEGVARGRPRHPGGLEGRDLVLSVHRRSDSGKSQEFGILHVQWQSGDAGGGNAVYTRWRDDIAAGLVGSRVRERRR
jgi:hypothetical protein